MGYEKFNQIFSDNEHYNREYSIVISNDTIRQLELRSYEKGQIKYNGFSEEREIFFYL